MAQSVSASLARFLFQDLFGSIIYFPAWWITRGFSYFINGYLSFLVRMQHRLAVGLWIKNIFTPMYGQYDAAGRIISFFMRSFQILARGAGFLIVAVVASVAIFIWVLLPAIAAVALLAQIVGLFL